MSDAIRPDEPGHITRDAPAPASPTHPLEVPDLRLPESWWGKAPIWILYGLAFFAPISLSSETGAGYVLFLWGFFCTLAYPFVCWTNPAGGYLVLCWLANPLFWIGLSLRGSRQRSRRLLGGVFGVGATLAALVWFLPWNNDAHVGPAYLLWCGSFVLLAVSGLIGGIMILSPPPQSAPPPACGPCPPAAMPRP